MARLNPFSVKKTAGGQTLLHRGNIPLHQSKEGSTKIEGQEEEPVTWENYNSKTKWNKKDLELFRANSKDPKHVEDDLNYMDDEHYRGLIEYTKKDPVLKSYVELIRKKQKEQKINPVYNYYSRELSDAEKAKKVREDIPDNILAGMLNSDEVDNDRNYDNTDLDTKAKTYAELKKLRNLPDDELQRRIQNPAVPKKLKSVYSSLLENKKPKQVATPIPKKEEVIDGTSVVDINPTNNTNIPVIKPEVPAGVNVSPDAKITEVETNVKLNNANTNNNLDWQKSTFNSNGVEGNNTQAVATETPKEVVKKSMYESIPDFSTAKNYNEATRLAREFHQKNGSPVGLFKYKGEMMGSALNTPQELAQFKKVAQQYRESKESEFSKWKDDYDANKIYSGSGIAGETQAGMATRVAQKKEYAKQQANQSFKVGDVIWDRYEGKYKTVMPEENFGAANTNTADWYEEIASKGELTSKQHKHYTELIAKAHKEAKNKNNIVQRPNINTPKAPNATKDKVSNAEAETLIKIYEGKAVKGELTSEEHKHYIELLVQTTQQANQGNKNNPVQSPNINTPEAPNSFSDIPDFRTYQEYLKLMENYMGDNTKTQKDTHRLMLKAVMKGLVAEQPYNKVITQKVADIVNPGLVSFGERVFNTDDWLFDRNLPKETLIEKYKKLASERGLTKEQNAHYKELLADALETEQFRQNIEKHNSRKAQGGSLNPFIPKGQNGLKFPVPNDPTNNMGYNSRLGQQSALGYKPMQFDGSTSVNNSMLNAMDTSNTVEDPLSNSRIEMGNRAGKPLMDTKMNFPTKMGSELEAMNYKMPVGEIATENGNNAINSASSYLKSNVTSGGNPASSGSNPLKGMSGSDMAFMGINAFNTAKGFLGRRQKPPVRSFTDRQDFIGTAKGLNPFQRQQSENNLMNSAMINRPNTTDARVNTAQSLGSQANVNQGLSQLNSQDSQMYDQSMNQQNQLRQAENMRMLSNDQRFQQGLQDEAMGNYKAQQAASQQSINSGMQSFYTMAKDKENQKRMAEAQNKNLIYGLYGQNAVAVQRELYSSNTAVPTDGKFAIRVMGNDGKITTQMFNTANEAYNARDNSLINKGVDLASMSRTQSQAQQFKEFDDIMNRAKGGRLNPFRASIPNDNGYTQQLMGMIRDMQRANNKRRLSNNNPFKSFGKGFGKK